MGIERSALWGLGLFTGLLAACSVAAPESHTEELAADAIVGPSLLLSGEIEAGRSEPILAPRTRPWGAAIRWLVDDGSEARQGDRILELDNSALVSGLEDLKVAVLEADNQLELKRILKSPWQLRSVLEPAQRYRMDQQQQTFLAARSRACEKLQPQTRRTCVEEETAERIRVLRRTQPAKR